MNIEETDELVAYLRSGGYIESSEEPQCTRLSGGVSNRTVMVERANGEAWVVKQALQKLRTQVDWFSDPGRIHREALGLQWIGRLAPPGATPAFLFEDRDHHLLAMQAVPQPHENWKESLLAGRLEDTHVEQFGSLLASIHGRAYRRRDEVEPLFADRTYFETLRLEPYYQYSARQVPPSAGFFADLIDATRTYLVTLVHGDYSPKNVLIHQDDLVLLDHEVAHFGDPAFDIGFSLTHLLSKVNHLSLMREAFREAAQHYWQVYRKEVGDWEWIDGLEARAVRHTLGCLLARVVGRSRLEYLNAAAQRRQREAACALMTRPPERISVLIDDFVQRL